MTTEISHLKFYHDRTDSCNGNFVCENALFVNLYSISNGGSMYIDCHGSLISLILCVFIANHADIRGGAISIGVASSLNMSKTCFYSNYAAHGHDIYMNTLLRNDMGKFSIDHISEFGGRASHGTIFGALYSSLFKNTNMTAFEGSTAYVFHYSSGQIEMYRTIIENATSVDIMAFGSTSSTIIIKELYSIYSGDNMFSLREVTGPIEIQDSVFIFKGTPTINDLGFNITIKRCTSNKEHTYFTQEANPKILLQQKIKCYGIMTIPFSKCKIISRYLLSLFLLENKEETSRTSAV